MWLLWSCCKAYCWRQACITISPPFSTILLLPGHHRMSNMVVCLVLPLLWLMANHLWCILPAVVRAKHIVPCLIFHVSTCILGCLCSFLLHWCLGSYQKFLHLCSHNGFFMTASLQCRVLGQACIICIFCIGVCIEGCIVVTNDLSSVFMFT